MNPNLNNRFTYAEQGPELETNTMPSQTQPDEVLSIREMLNRHTSGVPIPGTNREPIYYPEELGHVPDVERMDLTEIAEMVEHVTEKRKTLESELKKREADELAAKKAREKEERDMLEFFKKQNSKEE